MKNSGYSSQDIMAMQQDAIKRVQDMRRRSREKIESTNAGQKPARGSNNNQVPDKKKAVSEKSLPNRPQNTNVLSTIFKGNNLDNDRLIILAMVIVLLNEGADIKLIMALFYLLI